MFFPGHISGTPDEQRPQIDRGRGDACGEALDLWRQDGLEAKIVSGGSTPTALQSHHFNVLTEIRPGTYVFNGINELYARYATLDECAARVSHRGQRRRPRQGGPRRRHARSLPPTAAAPSPRAAAGTSSSIPRRRSCGSPRSTAKSMCRPCDAPAEDRPARQRRPQPHLPLRQPDCSFWWWEIGRPRPPSPSMPADWSVEL